MKKFDKVIGASLVLGSYTGSCYSEFNGFLFSRKVEKLVRYYNLYAAIIDTLSIFLSLEKVNRGVNLPASVLKEHHKVGNIVCYDGFTSTAVHDEKDYTGEPKNFFLQGKCTQRLYISYEDNGAKPGKLIKSGSLSPGEDEVLFEPGACFRVDKVFPRTDDVDPEDEDHECQDGERFNFELTLMPSDS